jgi:protein TonB
MSTVLEGGEELERELAPEPLARPAAGSLVLHGVLAGGIVLYGVLGGLFHHANWGSPGSGGAIQVTLVTSALPLPSDQPRNNNVLATETPSKAPAEPTPKAKQTVDEKAIPIASKQKKIEQKKTEKEAAPKAQTPKTQAPKTQTQTQTKTPPHQPVPRQENRAQFGEQAGSSMPRSLQTQGGLNNGPTSIGNGDFASRFSWYVDNINRKMATSWNKLEVDSRTPKGARVYLFFTIRRDGAPTDAQVDKSSGSPTLDRSCMRGVQRVDTFGQLPAAYNSSTLKVSYYCEY